MNKEIYPTELYLCRHKRIFFKKENRKTCEWISFLQDNNGDCCIDQCKEKCFLITYIQKI